MSGETEERGGSRLIVTQYHGREVRGRYLKRDGNGNTIIRVAPGREFVIYPPRGAAPCA